MLPSEQGWDLPGNDTESRWFQGRLDPAAREPNMPNLWIVHRDPAARRALARVAGVRAGVVSAAPGDRRFETAPDPDVVVLGLVGDFEAELEFAHRFAVQRPGASWVLVPEPGGVHDARHLFDALPAEILSHPPEPEAVRRVIRAAAAGRQRSDSLSERRVRDALADRFRRWFSDLELPELLRAVDPHLAAVPVLVRGEPGTGRTVVAQYIHVFGGHAVGAFVHVPCRGLRGAPEALDLIHELAGGQGGPLTICLEDVDTLPAVAQRQLRGWVENGLPPRTVRTERVRWIATAREDDPFAERTHLEPTLEDALAGILIHIPPLRDRMAALDAMVEGAAASWCVRHGQRTRLFQPEALAVLRDYLWLGNVREVEAVVARTLAARSDDPIPPDALVLEDIALDAEEVAGPEPELHLPAAAIPGARPTEIGRELPGEALAELDEPPPPAGMRLEPTPPPAESELPAEEPAPPEPPGPTAADQLRQLVSSIAHEIRNPLVAVQTFAQLLPERYDDPEFRRRAADIVGADVRRIESVVERLSRFAELQAPEPKPVDVVSILEASLEAQRDEIQRRRLVVLTELDRTAPHALGDPDQLRFAFESLLGKALELVPDRGDLYFASRHHRDGLDGAPCLRVLVRFRSPGELTGASEVPGVSLGEAALEIVVAQSVIQSHGGRMTISPGDARESVVVIDLPAPR